VESDDHTSDLRLFATCVTRGSGATAIVPSALLLPMAFLQQTLVSLLLVLSRFEWSDFWRPPELVASCPFVKHMFTFQVLWTTNLCMEKC
jgi:hypothetical protein